MDQEQRDEANVAAGFTVPAVQRFRFAFDHHYRAVARAFGVRDRSAKFDAGPVFITCTFGPWTVSTPLDNISAVSVTGPYAFLKTVGPARLSLSDRGITFATNGQRGVFLQFHRPVRGIDPFGLIRHPNLTVTVADCDGLVAALHARPNGS